ncbi:FAD-dependent monooxygenase [uncultured Halovibrio sp.]|uniref:NAD(P)/FAD-dependent oxidoreductase n=1 Tax=uncultured Halovibrio sp. TaxID=985049 RepID=UPI0025E16CF0|nr:FAD-dependent monooxygenase [uncultured Halovibrio sp.]
MVQRYDALIVGGGPAGSTMAQTLTQRGYHTLVVDKQTFPRDKTCAGWVTPAVLELLAINPDDYRRENIMQPIHRFRIGMMGQKAVENDHGSEPVSYGIRRCEFDHYLLERSGSDRAEGVKFKSLERTDDGEWCLNGEYQAPLVIGAGGHFCPVAATIGEGPGSHETSVTAKEVEGLLNEGRKKVCKRGVAADHIIDGQWGERVAESLSLIAVRDVILMYESDWIAVSVDRGRIVSVFIEPRSGITW